MSYPPGVRRLPLLFLVLGCAAAPPSTEEPAESMPAAEFAALERALLQQESLVLPFAIEAEGALTASLTGELRIEGPFVRLLADGDFAGEEVHLRLRADETSLLIGDAEAPRPPQLKEALILGLTRMGILHNLARLTGGRAPDHADVGVEPWLRVVVRSAEPYAMAIHVDGDEVAEAQLAVDGERLLWRTQTVSFPEGEMRVREQYRAR